MICFCPTCYNEKPTLQPMDVAQTSPQSRVTEVAANSLQSPSAPSECDLSSWHIYFAGESNCVDENFRSLFPLFCPYGSTLRSPAVALERRREEALERLKTWDPSAKFQLSQVMFQYNPYRPIRNNKDFLLVSKELEAFFIKGIADIIYDYQIEHDIPDLVQKFFDYTGEFWLNTVLAIEGSCTDTPNGEKILFLLGNIITILENMRSDLEVGSEEEDAFKHATLGILGSIKENTSSADASRKALETAVIKAIILSRKFGRIINNECVKLQAAILLRLWEKTEFSGCVQTLENSQNNRSDKYSLRAATFLFEWAVGRYGLKHKPNGESLPDPLASALYVQSPQPERYIFLEYKNLSQIGMQFLLAAAGIIELVEEE